MIIANIFILAIVHLMMCLVRRMAFIVAYLFLAIVQADTDNEKIPFMVEDRIKSSLVYVGWPQIRGLFFRPTINEIENMFHLTMSHQYGDETNTDLNLDDMRLQYVLFLGDYSGIIIEFKAKVMEKDVTCFVYSRLVYPQMSWTLNHHDCVE